MVQGAVRECDFSTKNQSVYLYLINLDDKLTYQLLYDKEALRIMQGS